MSSEVADLILYLITAVACAIWMIAFRCLWALNHARTAEKREGDEADRFDIDSTARRRQAEGEWVIVTTPPRVIPGRGETLSPQLARLIVHRFPGVKILSQSVRQIDLQVVENPMGPVFQSIEIHLTPLAEEQTEISCQIRQQPIRAPAWGWLLSALGVVAILAGFVLIKLFVVPHPSEAVRWQVIQMVQVIHFIWPPFLAVAFANTRQRAGQMFIEAIDELITNLPYLPPPSAATESQT